LNSGQAGDRNGRQLNIVRRLQDMPNAGYGPLKEVSCRNRLQQPVFQLKGRCVSLNGHEDVPSGLLVAGQASKDDMGAVVVKHHAPGLCGRSVDDQV